MARSLVSLHGATYATELVKLGARAVMARGLPSSILDAAFRPALMRRWPTCARSLTDRGPRRAGRMSSWRQGIQLVPDLSSKGCPDGNGCQQTLGAHLSEPLRLEASQLVNWLWWFFSRESFMVHKTDILYQQREAV
jgi:hypothetical protein